MALFWNLCMISYGSFVSQDTLKYPPHRGYIEGRKLLETPGAIYT